MNKTQEIYSQVTANLIAALESGTVPWRRPWVGGVPMNASSKTYYNGVNVLILTFQGLDKGYATSGWVTFKQAISHGCVVRKGEKSTAIIYSERKTARNDENPDQPKVWWLVKTFAVFNLDQLTDLPECPGSLDRLRARVSAAPGANPVHECEAMICRTGAEIRTAGQAFYDPSGDYIGMPLPETFESTERYYATMFHELGHWTALRVGRKLGERFGNSSYAAEELVAELTAAFLAQRFGFDVVSQSDAYLNSWITALKADPGILVKAASEASKAANFLFPVEAPEEAMAA